MSNERVTTRVEETLRKTNPDINAGTATENLFAQVEAAKKELSPKEFDQYYDELSKKLAERGLLPRLGLEYVRANYDDIDLSSGGGLSQAEINSFAQQRDRTRLEQQLLRSVLPDFAVVQDADSNDGVSGISRQDLGAAIRRQDDRHFKGRQSKAVEEHNRRAQEQEEQARRAREEVASKTARNLLGNGESLFEKIAGETGSASHLSFDDLNSINVRETEYRRRNPGRNLLLTDDELKVVRSLLALYDTSAGRELRENGGTGSITRDSLLRASGVKSPQELFSETNSASKSAAGKNKDSQSGKTDTGAERPTPRKKQDANQESSPVKPKETNTEQSRKTNPERKSADASSDKSASSKPSANSSDDTHESYSVEPGDSYWRIARKLLEQEGKVVSNKSILERMKELQKKNDFKNLRPGERIKT